MTVKVGINGFGRMGRLTLRAAFDWEGFEFIHVNDPAGDANTFAHLLTFDSVHGRWHPWTQVWVPLEVFSCHEFLSFFCCPAFVDPVFERVFVSLRSRCRSAGFSFISSRVRNPIISDRFMSNLLK